MAFCIFRSESPGAKSQLRILGGRDFKLMVFSPFDGLEQHTYKWHLLLYYCTGRDDWIRTSDPHTPSMVRYQAALRPETSASRPIRVGSKGCKVLKSAVEGV